MIKRGDIIVGTEVLGEETIPIAEFIDNVINFAFNPKKDSGFNEFGNTSTKNKPNDHQCL